MVKEIIQTMIREHLGWLVVWGGVFGGLFGPVAWNSSNVLANAEPAGEKRAASVPPASVPPASVEGRYLQVGAFSTSEAARQVQTKLIAAAKGSQVQVKSVERDGRSLYRVLIGPLSAEVIASELI